MSEGTHSPWLPADLPPSGQTPVPEAPTVSADRQSAIRWLPQQSGRRDDPAAYIEEPTEAPEVLKRDRRVSRRVSVPLPIAILGALIVGAGLLSLVLTSTDSSSQRTRTVVVHSATPAASSDVQVHVTRTPFEIQSARFAVFANPHQGWTFYQRAHSPGAGARWAFVEVLVRNLGQTAFDPRILRYRLQDGRGRVYLPSTGVGTGNAAGNLAGKHAIGVHALVRVELAFVVPPGTAGTRLLFEPAIRNGVPTIAVPLSV